MSIKLIAPWSVYAAGAVIGTLSAADEQRLIAAHIATTYPPIAADPAVVVRSSSGQVGIPGPSGRMMVDSTSGYYSDGQVVCDWSTGGTLSLISANSGDAVALDSTVLCDGAPMVRCTQGATGTYIADFLFTSPVYLGQLKGLHIPVRFDANSLGAWTGTSNSLQVWLYDDTTGTRQWRLSASLRGLDAGELRPGATHVLSFGPGGNSQGWSFGGASAPTSTTDLDSYSVARIRIVYTNAVPGAQCWVGPIRSNARRKGVVVVTMDGQYTSQDSYILPMRQAQGLRASLALQHNQIGVGGRMTEAQLTRAHDYGGHELIHHTYDGAKTAGYQSSGDWADAAAITADIAAGHAYQRARGWTRGVGYAVHGGSTHPYNASVSAARQAIVTAGYQAAGIAAIRRGNWVMGNLQRCQSIARPAAVDPYSVCGSIQVTSTDNAAAVTAVIDRARDRGEMAIITLHRSVVSTPGSLEMTNADIDTWTQHLGAQVRSGAVDCLPFGEACRQTGIVLA